MLSTSNAVTHHVTQFQLIALRISARDIKGIDNNYSESTLVVSQTLCTFVFIQNFYKQKAHL